MFHACAGIDKISVVPNSTLMHFAALTAEKAPCLTDSCLYKENLPLHSWLLLC